MSKLRNAYALDVRSLSALRVALGLLLLVNLYTRAHDLEAHYADHGVLPRAAVPQLGLIGQWTAPPACLSLHMLSGETWFQGLLFAVAAVPATMVLVGYRTRLALAVSWFFLIGIQARNPLVLNGGDDVLRCLALWGLFVPLDGVASLRPGSKTTRRVLSVGSVGLVLQLACVYWFTAILKTDAIWRRDFSAIYYALHADHFTTSFGYRLLDFPRLLTAMSAVVYWLELCGPTLLLCPWWSGRIRTCVALTFIGFHAGLVLTLRIGMFPWVCMAYWLVVLPGEFWDWIGWRSKPAGVSPERPTAAPWKNWAMNTTAGLLIVYVLALNLHRVSGGIEANLPLGPVQLLGDAAQLNQYWCMFAPAPPTEGGWLSFEGRLRDGRRVNLLHPHEPAYATQPPLVSATYDNERWRKFLLVLIERRSGIHREYLFRFLARRWNESHGSSEQLMAVEFLHLAKPTAPPGGAATAQAVITRRIGIWEFRDELAANSSQDLSGQAAYNPR